ncbi:hypothetical protein CDD83_5846 [Cordyceps sp. RAO-2017]|nr:hypothetical protein CDD83_5846 [Cordyceps sp. RAO-2017]
MAKLATILFVSVALLLLLLPNGVVGSGGRSRPPGSSRPSRRNRLHRGSTGDDSPLEDGSQPSDDGPGGFDGTPDLSLVYAFTTGRGQKTRIDDDPSDARHDPSAPGAIPPNLDGGAPSLRRQGGFRHRSRPAGPQQEGGQQEPRTSPRGHQLNRRPAFRTMPCTP